MENTSSAGWYRGGVICKLLGITKRRLEQLSADGVVPESQGGLYHLGGCITKYIEFIKNNTAGREASDYTKNRSDLAIQQRRKLQRKNDAADLELIQRQDLEEVVGAVKKLFSDELKKFYSRSLIDELVALDEPAATRECLKVQERLIRDRVAKKTSVHGQKQYVTSFIYWVVAHPILEFEVDGNDLFLLGWLPSLALVPLPLLKFFNALARSKRVGALAQ